LLIAFFRFLSVVTVVATSFLPYLALLHPNAFCTFILLIAFFRFSSVVANSFFPFGIASQARTPPGSLESADLSISSRCVTYTASAGSNSQNQSLHYPALIIAAWT